MLNSQELLNISIKGKKDRGNEGRKRGREGGWKVVRGRKEDFLIVSNRGKGMLCKKQLIAFKIKEQKKSEEFVYGRGDKAGFKKGTLGKNKLRTMSI